jgi:hypothetical protein
MKKLILALLVVMLAAGAAYAVDVQVVKGAYYVRGSHFENTALHTSNEVSRQLYDHDMDLYVDFVVDETTKVVTYFELVDENWSGYDKTQTTGQGFDDQIEVKRVYLDHKFPTGTILDAGKMSGGTWGTAFDDQEGPAYRVKVTQMFPWGLVVGLVQKVVESSSSATKDSEKDDFDVWVLGAVFNVGPVAVMPAYLHYIGGSSVIDQDDDDAIIDNFKLALAGNFGMIGFEAEYVYWDYDYDTTATGLADVDIAGWYANVWANFDAFKIGGMYYHEGFDEDSGKAYAHGEDLAETLVVGDTIYPAPAAGRLGQSSGPAGLDCFQVYADFSFGKFSFNGSLTYYSSNIDAGTDKWRDAEIIEYDLGAGYAITDNLTYSVAVGVANIDYDDSYGGDDPGQVVRAYHKLAVSF